MIPTLRTVFLLPLLRRLLLLAGLVLMLPACEDFNSFEELRRPTELIELGANEPVVIRRLRLVAAGKPGTHAKVSWPYLSATVSRFWTRSDEGGAEAVHPWMRVRLVDEADGNILGEDVVAFDAHGSVRDAHLANSTGRDDEAERFDVTYRLEFERQGPPSDGVIRLTWEAHASVSSSGDRDEVEFTVTQP
ncbi:MAG: hypothetical protein EOO71_23405 [Myxococcaceae bacterium]|nr:MAG: hypothetical protein EOO71_23405 [Myxococcaceae bacterium]